MTVVEEFTQVGRGRAVFTAPDVVEGPVVWLDSPKAVIEFVKSGDVENSIVLARGGTTTFLTPALTAGVKGVMTLQGAPSSHLGILSREFGIPCVMGIQFEDGVRSSRGEVIPAEGATVRLDISEPEGRIFIEPGAPTAGAKGEPTEEELALAEQMKQVEVLLHHFRGEVPHGSEGDTQMHARMKTDVMKLTDDSLRRDLTPEEANDFQEFASWNVWDALALRSTEGESGLIPRQEYEAFGCVQQWRRFPAFVREITEKLGVDGLVEIGGIPRREVGNKVNQLHIWCTAITPLFGRGLLTRIGLEEAGARPEDVLDLVQFQRRLTRGMWDDEGVLFGSGRGYRSELLDRSWIDRFASEATPLDDDELTGLHKRFNATTEITGFLLHFDNRSGLSDTGPYDLGDGRFMIVRDHFLHDDAYNWHDVAEGLPHCLTQAMIFEPKGDLHVNVLDIGTLFSEPASYLDSLVAMGVYARDTWDTPVEQIRRVEPDEMQEILALCDDATTRLYNRISRMTDREKIMAGAQVYYTEFVAPIARAAGLWDRFVEELDFFEFDRVASDAYFPLVVEKQAAKIVPEGFLMGNSMPPLAVLDVDAHAAHYPSLRALALRGMLADVPGDTSALEEADLVVSTGHGIMLSETGHAVHTALAEKERREADTERLAQIYERFLPINVEFKAACSRWHDADGGGRAGLLGDLAAILDRLDPALRRSGEIIERFGSYAPRLRDAHRAAEGGDHDAVTSASSDSLHTVWMEMHEDYIQVLGIDREEEGSY